LSLLCPSLVVVVLAIGLFAATVVRVEVSIVEMLFTIEVLTTASN
jgi:hypothetical protein